MSGSKGCPCASVSLPVYTQLTLLTLLPFNCGSAGVSHILSPAVEQLEPFTSSSVNVPFVVPCV